MAHQIDKRTKDDVSARCVQALCAGEFTWPEIVMGAAEFVGLMIGTQAENGMQGKELITYAQRFMVQAAHTAGEAKGKSGLIIQE